MWRTYFSEAVASEQSRDKLRLRLDESVGHVEGGGRGLGRRIGQSRAVKPEEGALSAADRPGEDLRLAAEKLRYQLINIVSTKIVHAITEAGTNQCLLRKSFFIYNIIFMYHFGFHYMTHDISGIFVSCDPTGIFFLGYSTWNREWKYVSLYCYPSHAWSTL